MSFDDQGRVVAVWGPHGAPGRTTVAVHLAELLAREGRTLLIDADLKAPSVAVYFGLLLRTQGLLSLTHSIRSGSFESTLFEEKLWKVMPHLDVLPAGGEGLDAGPLTAKELAIVLSLARQRYEWIVIDTSAELETESRETPTPHGSRQPSLSAEVVRNADAVVALVAGDVLSVQRFLRALPALKTKTNRVLVVGTKLRRSALGLSGRRGLDGTLERYAKVRPVAFLPWVSPALDRELLRSVGYRTSRKPRVYTQQLDEVAHQVRALARGLGQLAVASKADQ